MDDTGFLYVRSCFAREKFLLIISPWGQVKRRGCWQFISSIFADSEARLDVSCSFGIPRLNFLLSCVFVRGPGLLRSRYHSLLRNIIKAYLACRSLHPEFRGNRT